MPSRSIGCHKSKVSVQRGFHPLVRDNEWCAEREAGGANRTLRSVTGVTPQKASHATEGKQICEILQTSEKGRAGKAPKIQATQQGESNHPAFGPRVSARLFGRSPRQRAAGVIQENPQEMTFVVPMVAVSKRGSARNPARSESRQPHPSQNVLASNVVGQ